MESTSVVVIVWALEAECLGVSSGSVLAPPLIN